MRGVPSLPCSHGTAVMRTVVRVSVVSSRYWFTNQFGLAPELLLLFFPQQKVPSFFALGNINNKLLCLALTVPTQAAFLSCKEPLALLSALCILSTATVTCERI